MMLNAATQRWMERSLLDTGQHPSQVRSSWCSYLQGILQPLFGCPVLHCSKVCVLFQQNVLRDSSNWLRRANQYGRYICLIHEWLLVVNLPGEVFSHYMWLCWSSFPCAAEVEVVSVACLSPPPWRWTKNAVLVDPGHERAGLGSDALFIFM